MPGVDLLPGYERRQAVTGVALTSSQFLQHGLLPTLRSLGAARSELFRALQRQRHREAAQHAEPADAAAHAG
jgi:hypothetical protein